ncbi:RNA-directed DNA polymerase [Planctomycetota bacterium]|nr:RNA-directed DNA polymerase [Planctomycetota bacterium]
MGIFNKLKSLFSSNSSEPQHQTPTTPARFNLLDLEHRLDISHRQIKLIPLDYHTFTVPKSNGHKRLITAPNPELKKLQRTIAKRLLTKLAVHPNAVGFRKNHSVVTNAKAHTNSPMIIKLDIRNFFQSTPAQRVNHYFRFLGYDADSAQLLTSITTHIDHLPQGAPTSPILSNLLNYKLDTALTTLAQNHKAIYTRYADDITFSLDTKDSEAARNLVNAAAYLLHQFGYKLNNRKKRIIRNHRQQRVTGLVVNEKVNLPRETRRLIRAIQHAHDNNKPTTHSPQQLQSLKAYHQMIITQSEFETH